MIDKTGVYGFGWGEWLWFVALFFSFLVQATLVAMAYRNMRRRIAFAIYRINKTSRETRKLVDAMWDDVADAKVEEVTKEGKWLWQRK